MNILFNKTYDSESIVDMGRDVSECFDERFNENAKNLTEDSSVLASFIFKNKDGGQQLLNKVYTEDSYGEIEGALYSSLSNLRVEQDQYGFFDGDLVVNLVIQNS